MPDEIHISHRVNKLKLKAATRYNISPETCHIGHIALEGMLGDPNMLNQILHNMDTAQLPLKTFSHTLPIKLNNFNYESKPIGAKKNQPLHTFESSTLLLVRDPTAKLGTYFFFERNVILVDVDRWTGVHTTLPGYLEKILPQIDGGTGQSETNLSVATRSMRLANAMRNSGLRPGDAVIVMGPNHLDLAIPYYACHFNGFSMCAMDPSVCTSDLLELFPNIRPKLIFCPKICEDKMREALRKNDMEAPMVLFDEETNNLETFIQSNGGTETNFRPAEFDQSATTAWLMLTSGTTGTPKVAIIPFDRLLNGVIFWWTPFSANIGITMTMATIQWLSSLMFFISSSMKRFTRLQSSVPITPQLLVGLINNYKPNVTAWTPYLLGQFLAAAGSVCDLSCFKYIAIGGSAIEKPLLDQFKEKCNAYLYLVYGMTELLVPGFDFVEDTPFGSTGKAFKHFHYKLVGENNEEVNKSSEGGELWIKGDTFFKGYLNNPEETSKILTEDGWFKTGDIFYKDENGFFFFVERKKILIRYVGYWIPPLQLEEVIRRHPEVLEACVVGIPNPQTMELPVAAIMRKNGTKIDPQQIFKLLKDALPDLKQLHGGLFFVDSLPVTPSGKVHRAKVFEMACTAQRILP